MRRGRWIATTAGALTAGLLVSVSIGPAPAAALTESTVLRQAADYAAAKGPKRPKRCGVAHIRWSRTRTRSSLCAMERIAGVAAGFLYMATPTMHMHTLKIALIEPPPDFDLALVSRETACSAASAAVAAAPRSAAEGIGLKVTAWSYLDRMNFSLLACPDLLPELEPIARRLRPALDVLAAERVSA